MYIRHCNIFIPKTEMAKFKTNYKSDSNIYILNKLATQTRISTNITTKCCKIYVITKTVQLINNFTSIRHPIGVDFNISHRQTLNLILKLKFQTCHLIQNRYVLNHSWNLYCDNNSFNIRKLFVKSYQANWYDLQSKNPIQFG